MSDSNHKELRIGDFLSNEEGVFYLDQRGESEEVIPVCSPLVAIAMLLFIFSVCTHMRIGMQVVIEDYVHEDKAKLTLVMLNTFYAAAVGIASAFAILKLSFGV